VSSKIETIRSVKGTRDLLPSETYLWQCVESDVRRVFGAYNFDEIRTPVLEQTALFARTVGADTDIVSKEMFTFDDRERESLSLRPEATASVVRAYIEHSLYNEGRIHKLYYLGPMFRRERPQKGRYRQFYQIGAEVLGSDSPLVDAEVLEMLVEFLQQVGGVGVGEFALLINSVGCAKCRPEYLKSLRRALESVEVGMCADCQRRARTNPLRVFDCKVEADQPIIAKLPTIFDHLDPECRQHFETVTSELKERGITYQIAPRLVRGLDYYTRTTFEITSGALGAQDAILGGGRYDGLSEMLGGPPTPGIGFAIGQDRLILVVSETAKQLATQPKWKDPLSAYIVWLGDSALEPANRLARELRHGGSKVAIGFEPTSVKKSMGLANRLGARFAIIIGDVELAAGRYQVKDMASGQQVEMAPERISAHLKVPLP
jgi:histidyl-tRNA synthetase